MKFMLSVVLFVALASSGFAQQPQYPMLYGNILDFCAFECDMVAPLYIKLSAAGQSYYNDANKLLLQLIAKDRGDLYDKATKNKPADYANLTTANPTNLGKLGKMFGYPTSTTVQIPADFDLCVWESGVRVFVTFNFQPDIQRNIGNVVSEVFRLLGGKVQSYFKTIGDQMGTRFNALSSADKNILIQIGTVYGYLPN